MTMGTHDEIRALKDRYSSKLLSTAGVCGVGIEKSGDDYVLVVHLDDSKARERLPQQLDGHEIRYVVSGPFSKT